MKPPDELTVTLISSPSVVRRVVADAGEVQEGPQHKAPKYLSETDPQSAWSIKDGPGRFSYETNYLIDTDHGIIMDVEATPARLSQEIVAAKKMLARTAERHAFRPDALAADKSYGTGPFLAWLGCSSAISHHMSLCWTANTRRVANMI